MRLGLFRHGLQQKFAGNTLRDFPRKLLTMVGLMHADASVRLLCAKLRAIAPPAPGHPALGSW